MSYLTLPDGLPDFSQAVISLWFRVPQASIDAASADVSVAADYDVPLRGIIPFITFGPSMPLSFDSYGGADLPPVHLGDSFTGPGYIGLKCYADDVPSLIVRLQTQSYADGYWRPPYSTATFGSQPGTGDYFAVGDTPYYSPLYAGGSVPNKYIEPEADRWHHVLISFDVGLPISYSHPLGFLDANSFTSACKFWWAYDDENQGGDTLHPYGLTTYPTIDAPYSGDPNLITSAYFNTGFGAGEAGVPESVITDFDYTFPPLPTAVPPFGLPSTEEWIAKIYKVEMAELQIFTGVTLDTSIEANRRAFIDKDGKPVPPVAPLDEDGNPILDRFGNPEQPPAEKLLGQKPDVLLHGSGNWIKGRNTGPEFPDPDPDAALTPTGKIISYSPGPSLFGPQSPPPATTRMRIAR